MSDHLQIRRGKRAAIEAAGLLPGEPAVAMDDPASPELLVGTPSGIRSLTGGVYRATVGAPSAPPIGTVNIYADYSMVPLIPSQTSLTANVFASSAYYSTPPWAAFSNSNVNGWINDGTKCPCYIGWDFGSPTIVEQYSIVGWYADNFPTRCPKSWQFQAWDGTKWVSLDERTFTSWVLSKAESFTVASPGKYTKYRLYITANMGDSYTGIRLLDMRGRNESTMRLFMQLSDGTKLRLAVEAT